MVKAFLAEDHRFAVDPTRERFILTNCPRGFLRRIR
jgi:NUC153 domain